jgi:hypothetical protein
MKRFLTLQLALEGVFVVQKRFAFSEPEMISAGFLSKKSQTQ